MMPFWIYTLGSVIGTLQVPFVDILRTFATALIPTGIGVGFRYWKPELAAKCRLAVKIFSLFILVVVLVFGVYANLYIFQLFKWYTVVCGFLLPWTGYGLSYLIAWLVRQDARNRLTIAIETGIQNTGEPNHNQLGEPTSCWFVTNSQPEGVYQ